MKSTSFKPLIQLCCIVAFLAVVSAFGKEPPKKSSEVFGHVISEYVNGPITVFPEIQRPVIVEVPAVIDVYTAPPNWWPPRRHFHSQFVGEVISDEAGYFLVTNLKAGNYWFEVTPAGGPYSTSVDLVVVPVNFKINAGMFPQPDQGRDGILDFFVPYVGVYAF